MSRTLRSLPALLGLAILSVPGFAQDQSQDQQPPQQPSLADVARQNRKDKEKNAGKSKNVFTDDNFSSSKGLGGLSADSLGSTQGGDGSALAKAMARVDEAEASLKLLDSLDRAALAKAVLVENDVDFPNRHAWEDKLFAEKQRYVSHERELIAEMRQVVARIQAMPASNSGQSKLDANDPQAQQIKQKLVDIMQDAIRTEQAYRAVVMEGWDLAKQAKH